jgi:hypothetical protein
VNEIPTDPRRRGRGTNVLMLLVLLLLIGGTLGWAFLKNPPGTAPASATGAPATMPQGETPPRQ